MLSFNVKKQPHLHLIRIIIVLLSYLTRSAGAGAHKNSLFASPQKDIYLPRSGVSRTGLVKSIIPHIYHGQQEAEFHAIGKKRNVDTRRCGAHAGYLESDVGEGENMSAFIDRTGETRVMNNGLTAKIVNYRNTNDVDVMFSNGQYARNKPYASFRSGSIKCPLIIEQHGDVTKVINANQSPQLEFLIDTDNIPLLTERFPTRSCYGYVRLIRNTIFLHRIIAGAKCNEIVDHINCNKLDNRRCNLRICTVAENGRNRSKPKNNSSGYKGVSFVPKVKKWSARINIGGKDKYLGRYSEASEAAKAYDRAAIMYHGEYAHPNEYVSTEGGRF